jgi:hypothetical protein
MRKLGLVLLAAGAAWLLLFGVLIPVYIEPGPTGDFDCAAVWQQQSLRSFEIPGWSKRCQRAIDRRREALLLPVLLACAGGALVVTETVRKRRAHSSVEFGCDYCADDINRFYGHVTQIGTDEERGLILLRCPRCGAMYENTAGGYDETRRLTVEEATGLYGTLDG